MMKRSGIQRSSTKVLAALLILAVAQTANAQPPGQRWALLIGIDQYFKLAPLDSASSEAESLKTVLEDRCHFDHIVTMVDKPSENAQGRPYLNLLHSNLQTRIQSFIKEAEAQQVRTVAIYFNGHGHVPTDGSDLLLCAIDATIDNESPVNVLSRRTIESLLHSADIPEKMLILDCCHAAEGGKTFGIAVDHSEAAHIEPTNVDHKNKFVVLSSSGANQKSAERNFTKHLIAGLAPHGRSARDENADNRIDVNELYRFVRKSMLNGPANQTPVQKVISGGSDIVLASKIKMADPLSTLDVYVLSDDEKPVREATVALSFADKALQRTVVLGEAQTSRSGRAHLDVRLKSTLDREGDYQLTVRSTEGDTIYRLNDLQSLQDGFEVALHVSNTPLASFQRNVDSSAASRSGQEAEMHAAQPVPVLSHADVMRALSDYIAHSGKVENLCALKVAFPDFGKLMSDLSPNMKTKIGGFIVCFPSKETWEQRPDLREKILASLTSHGVIARAAAQARTREFVGRDPSYEDIKAAANRFVANVAGGDVCDLRELAPGYSALIDSLDKSEKVHIFGNLPICFPTEETWNKRADFRRRMISLLWAAKII